MPAQHAVHYVRHSKYLCLVYLDEKRLHELPDEDCVAYDTAIRQSGHCIASAALQSVQTATTVRVRDGKVAITDGPYAETKEQIGGILMLEANDLNHAIQLMSKHPGVRGGPFEIRPAADLTGMIRDSARRRAK